MYVCIIIYNNSNNNIYNIHHTSNAQKLNTYKYKTYTPQPSTPIKHAGSNLDQDLGDWEDKIIGRGDIR